MSSNSNTRNEADANFNFGVRELRQAKTVAPLRVEAKPLIATSEDRGSDPYNTSGSFDRKKNWSRVGKR